MDRKEFFCLMKNPGKRKILAVAVEGDQAGSRVLFEDGELSGEYGAKEQGLFSEAEKAAIIRMKETGLLEGDGRRIFVEIPGGRPQLVICGGGHVAQQVIPLAVRLGFYTTVLEDRPSFADAARAAGAQKVICEEFEKALAGIPGNRDTYFLVVTRGHRHDGVCLRKILKKQYAYVGMMASRGRAALLKKQLAAEGADPSGLDSLYTPVGLSIGAETPEEIAVSIAAELIQVKNRAKKENAWDEELTEYLTGCREPGGQMVLATIISRQGSAPRGVGTKMLVLADGRLVGTIGGGCLESEIRQQCLHLLRGAGDVRLIRADLTNKQAGDEGLVCGGRIEVLAEVFQAK